MEKCSTCNADLGQGRCKICRRNEYYLKQGHKIDDPCKTCLIRTRLYRNGDCGPCMELKGLRECSLCHEIKGRFLSFEERQSICRDCRVPLSHLPAALRRKHAALKHYGISYDQYLSMVIQQNGLCGICKKKCTQTMAIDHDHRTGKVRGLLCRSCNVGLGFFRDSTEVLDRARAYLQTNGSGVECPPDQPLFTAEIQQEFDRKVLTVEIETLRERLEFAEEALRERQASNNPDLLRALVLALKREFEVKKPSQQRTTALEWLDGLL